MNKLGVILILGSILLATWLYDPGVSVYQLTHHLGPTASISKDHLKAIKVSKKMAHQHMLRTLPESMYVKANVTLLPGDILRQEHITDALMDGDARLVSLKADIVTAQGHAIRVLDAVDVYVTTRHFSGTLIEGATLIAMKDRHGEDITSGIPALITLSVHKDHVAPLLLGMEKGHLSLHKLERDAMEESILNQSIVDALND